MKITALRLFNVKRFAGRGVAIEDICDGVNVLCAANEFGKSTSFEALHALFCQPHTGTAAEVRRLRPYSGGSPMVEVDITAHDGRFRITKQYYGGRLARVTDIATGRLLAQADEAENFIGCLIKGGTAGPAGLLWVRQGVTGIERRTPAEEESERQVRASLLESVQGEVEAVTGGRRMAEIMGQCTRALSELVTTTGRPRSNTPYANAIEERNRLATEAQRLGREVEGLREALDKRATASRRLQELEQLEEKRERRTAVECARAAFESAKAQGETLRAAEAEVRAARERRDRAARDLGTFRGALAKKARVCKEIEAAESRREEATRRRRDAFDRIEKAEMEVEASEAAENEARGFLARLDAAMQARKAAERLSELRQRLSDAEAARQAMERGEAALTLLRLPPKAVDELQKLDGEITQLRAVEEVGRPTVAIAYEAGAQTIVALDGHPLADGDECGYKGRSRLSVPGVAVVTLRSNRPPRADDRLKDLVEKRRTLLAAMGSADIADARRRETEALRKAAVLGELRGRIEALAPSGLAALREEVARHDVAALEALELKEDPETARKALAEAEQKRAEARNALREARPTRAGAEDAYVSAERTLASLGAELAQFDAILGAESARAERERELVDALVGSDGDLAICEVRYQELCSKAVDLEAAEATLRRAASVEEAAAKEAADLRETIAILTGRIHRDADEAIEEAWHEAAEASEAAARRVRGFELEIAVLQRLRGALESSRSAARDLYLKPVMTELRPLLGLLFEDASITFDETTLLPQSILRNGQEEDVERLSGGMREQLSVLTRLAFARLLARDGRSAPIILDDGLVYSDDDRIERMFDALHRQSRDQQIIVFSCRQRAFSKLGGNVLHMTDWNGPE